MSENDTTTAAAAPRTRWAGIVFGAAFAAAAIAGVVLLALPDGGRLLHDGLRPAMVQVRAEWVLAGLLLLLGVLAVTGGAAALRRRGRADAALVAPARRDDDPAEAEAEAEAEAGAPPER